MVSGRTRTLKDERAKMAKQLISEGKTRDEIAAIMGVHRCTINNYLRLPSQKRVSRKANAAAIKKLLSAGMTKDEIAEKMGMQRATVDNYLKALSRERKQQCEKCGAIGYTDLFRGQYLCAACLLNYDNPADRVSIEYAMKWGSIKNSGAMSCG